MHLFKVLTITGCVGGEREEGRIGRMKWKEGEVRETGRKKMTERERNRTKR